MFGLVMREPGSRGGEFLLAAIVATGEIFAGERERYSRVHGLEMGSKVFLACDRATASWVGAVNSARVCERQASGLILGFGDVVLCGAPSAAERHRGDDATLGFPDQRVTVAPHAGGC